MSLLQVFSEITTQRSGFGQNSCAADKQACVFGSSEFNKHSVLKLSWLVTLIFQQCNLQAYNFTKPNAKSKSFCTIVNMPALGTVPNLQRSISIHSQSKSFSFSMHNLFAEHLQINQIIQD